MFDLFSGVPVFDLWSWKVGTVEAIKGLPSVSQDFNMPCEINERNIDIAVGRRKRKLFKQIQNSDEKKRVCKRLEQYASSSSSPLCKGKIVQYANETNSDIGHSDMTVNLLKEAMQVASERGFGVMCSNSSQIPSSVDFKKEVILEINNGGVGAMNINANQSVNIANIKEANFVTESQFNTTSDSGVPALQRLPKKKIMSVRSGSNKNCGLSSNVKRNSVAHKKGQVKCDILNNVHDKIVKKTVQIPCACSGCKYW